jgi:hypothetical protein
MYVLVNLQDGFYIVLAVPQGDFLPTFHDGLGGTTQLEGALPVAVAGEAVDGIDIQVQPDTISGMNRVCGVVSADGVPVPGTIVYAVSQQSNEPTAVAITEQNGGYSIVGLAPGTYTFRASKPGFESATSATFDIEYQSGLPTSVFANFSLLSLPTSADEGGATRPVEFLLLGNYPNPFNPSTTIGFTIPIEGRVRLAVYNLLGEQIANPLDAVLHADEHELVWDARSPEGEVFSSGVYYYRVEFDGGVKVGKMMLLR